MNNKIYIVTYKERIGKKPGEVINQYKELFSIESAENFIGKLGSRFSKVYEAEEFGTVTVTTLCEKKLLKDTK